MTTSHDSIAELPAAGGCILFFCIAVIPFYITTHAIHQSLASRTSNVNDLRKRVGNLVAAFYVGKDMKICNFIVSITTSLLF